MARSNGAAHMSGQGPQAWPPSDVDAQGRPIDPRWAPPQGYGAPAPGYATPQPHPAHPHMPAQAAPYPAAPQQANYPPQEPGHYFPSELQAAPQQAYAYPQSDPYAGQPGYPAVPDAHLHEQHVGRQSGAPHFERFAPQPAAEPSSYDRFDTQLRLDPQAQPYAAPAQPQSYPHAPYHPQPGQAGDPRGYEAQPMPSADPRGWDLAQYPPQHAQAPYPVHDPHQAGMAPRWPGAQGWQPPVPHGYPERGYDPAQHGVMPGHPAPAPGPLDAVEAEIEEEDEPRRGPRAMVVIAALIGAIALGGGLAYGYKKFAGPAAPTKTTPVVKADKSPPKTKPVEPGGKDQPHTDKKFLNRLAEEKGTAPATPPAAAPGPVPAEQEAAPRKVTTVIVNRDGTITPTAPPAPAPVPEPPPPAAQPANPIPGMVVEGVAPRPDLRGPAPVGPAAAQPPPAARAAPPKVAELPLPKAKAPPAQQSGPTKKKPAVRDDLVTQKQGVAPTPAATGAGGANGYVAVLTSRKSREDALKSFADLHQKYPDLLNGRTPDVREKDFGDATTGPKGVWYRLIVGPPGSKEAARELCQKLDAQGFRGCFSMAY